MELTEFIVPAVDIREGKVVRLLRGEFERAKVYPYSPRELAQIYDEAGFKRIHVVDLDGAEGGKPRNLEHIREVRSAFGGEIEFGGGVRSYEMAKNLYEEGIDYVVIGTLAVKKPEEFGKIVSDFPNRVILSIDSKGGRVAVGGWKEESKLTPGELAKLYEGMSLWGYLYTIIEKDGSLEGVDVEPYKKIKSVVNKPVLASGGVSSLEDVKRLQGLVDGVVVGKAIYEGRIPIPGLI
ncbi:1-(5-phosphoribosyl)-5-[(5-phosphoribosylamino)methylideneamino]imidazole-4-carboxamide isomerase [Hydrogenivirga sp.]